MPTFNPALPVDGSIIAAAELRDQLNALKALIDAIPLPATLGRGTGTLDGSGQLIVMLPVVATAFVAMAQGGMFNPNGWLRVDGSGTTWTIISSAGAADVNVNVMYIYY